MAGKAERNRAGARRLYGRRVALRDGQGCVSRAGFSLHLVNSARGPRESHRRAGARDRWPTCPFFTPIFPFNFFVLIFLPVMSKTRQWLCNGVGAGQPSRLRQADLVAPQILSVSQRQSCQGWRVILPMVFVGYRLRESQYRAFPYPDTSIAPRAVPFRS